MINFWSLKINCEDSLKDSVSVILGVKPNIKYGWELEKIEEEEDPYVNYIEYFLDLLEFNYEKLSAIGVERTDIAIWRIYEYNDQCNMEFSPTNMYRLGSNGITLCVSCYDMPTQLSVVFPSCP